ncbi:MAG: class I SAM-dependent methyltransferase [bacterium]
MGYRDICYQIYWKLESKIAPTLKYSQAIYESVLNEYIHENCKWLDLGCGHNLLPPWRYEQERQLVGRTNYLVGLDYDFNSLKKHKTIQKRIRDDINHLPFDDGFFDIVTSNMVFEHLKEPLIQIKEIHRVLKPGGVLLFHTPNSFSYSTILAKLIPESIKGQLVWLLQDRKEEDVFPAYYRINTSKDIKRFAKIAGFEIDKIKMITSTAQLVMIPPLVFFELIFIRILMTDRMKAFRANIISKLVRPVTAHM